MSGIGSRTGGLVFRALFFAFFTGKQEQEYAKQDAGCFHVGGSFGIKVRDFKCIVERSKSRFLNL
jgi:hypothetical protein